MNTRSENSQLYKTIRSQRIIVSLKESLKKKNKKEQNLIDTQIRFLLTLFYYVTLQYRYRY